MNEPVYHLDSVVRARAETLEDFDGPLDVILLLLSKNKIEIQDVNITSILEQYLAWLDERKRMDMEVASEFIAMASHLMYIKTRMLLSKAEQEEAAKEFGEMMQDRLLAMVRGKGKRYMVSSEKEMSFMTELMRRQGEVQP